MPIWLLIVLIVGVALVATLFVYVVAHRDQLFKKHQKKASAKKVAKKTVRKQKKTVQAPPPPQPTEQMMFEEKVVEQKHKDFGDRQAYVPTAEYAKKGEVYDPIASAQVARRRPRAPQPPPVPVVEDDFDDFRNKHGYSSLYKKSIKDQIKDLSPEMKAILFGKVLDRKDDDEDEN